MVFARTRMAGGLLGLMVLATGLTGCAHVLTGTLVGAGVGAIAGGRTGTAIGAGAGALSGAFVAIYEGIRRDEQRAKRYLDGPVHRERQSEPAPADVAPAEIDRSISRAELPDSPAGRQLRVVDEQEYEAYLRWRAAQEEAEQR